MPITYGAQQNGLLCGYRFSPTACGEPIDLAQAVDWLKTHPAAQPGDVDFIWLHFDLTSATSQAWMQANLPLAPERSEELV